MGRQHATRSSAGAPTFTARDTPPISSTTSPGADHSPLGVGRTAHPGHPCIDQCVASIQFANGHRRLDQDAATSPFTTSSSSSSSAMAERAAYDRFKKATFFDGKKTWVEERPDEEGFLENREFISALRSRQPVLSLTMAFRQRASSSPPIAPSAPARCRRCNCQQRVRVFGGRVPGRKRHARYHGGMLSQFRYPPHLCSDLAYLPNA